MIPAPFEAGVMSRPSGAATLGLKEYCKPFSVARKMCAGEQGGMASLLHAGIISNTFIVLTLT
jgi:hypothetical protein